MRLLAWIPVLLLLHPPAALGEGAEGTDPHREPAQVVEKLHVALIEVMKNADSLGYEGRYETLDPVLRECFDSPFMAEKSVGRYWKSAGEAERTQLVETFARFTTANYAGRFNGYSGQHFEPPRVEPSSRGTLLARSRLVEPGGEGTQLNYRLRPVDGRWRIIDVYLNGTVSELALRRSEYSSMIKREGIDGLLTALQAHIDGLETTGAEQSL